MSDLRTDLRALRAAPRELWLLYAVKLLESVSYFTVYALLVIFLSDDHGLGDTEAGSVSGLWLTAISLVVFGAGFLSDSLGMKRALLAAAVSAAVGRGVLALFGGDLWSVYLGLALSVWGIATFKPTMNAAVRAWAPPTAIPFAFSLYYVVMNLGAILQGPLVDGARRFFKDGVSFAGIDWSPARLVFLVGFVLSLLNIGLVAAMRPPAEMGEVAGSAPARRPWQIAKEVVVERAFWWFMLVVGLLTFVRLIFQHAHLTWPKYTLRAFGDDFPFATYWALNPAIIIVLTPIATALTRRLPTYPVLVSGALLTGLSVLPMVFSTTKAASVAFIVILSIGEALWSPRLYEYTATVAPRGREASYMGLSELPLFLAKPVVGTLSGWMLATWMPAEGARNPALLWAVIAAMTLFAPIIMGLGRRHLDRAPAR